jgi:hypothetical protein
MAIVEGCTMIADDDEAMIACEDGAMIAVEDLTRTDETAIDEAVGTATLDGATATDVLDDTTGATDMDGTTVAGATDVPFPSTPPSTPAAENLAAASAGASHTKLVPDLATRGRAKQDVPAAHFESCHLPLTHRAKADEMHAWEPSKRTVSFEILHKIQDTYLHRCPLPSM